MRPTRGEHGSAVVDFVLVMVLLVPLVFGIAQVALVLHVRNTGAAAASEGARAAAALDASLATGTERTRAMIRDSLADRYADDVTARWTEVRGAPGVVVTVRARVPALGLFGPAMTVESHGHAVREVAP